MQLHGNARHRRRTGHPIRPPAGPPPDLCRVATTAVATSSSDWRRPRVEVAATALAFDRSRRPSYRGTDLGRSRATPAGSRRSRVLTGVGRASCADRWRPDTRHPRSGGEPRHAHAARGFSDTGPDPGRHPGRDPRRDRGGSTRESSEPRSGSTSGPANPIARTSSTSESSGCNASSSRNTTSLHASPCSSRQSTCRRTSWTW